MSVRHVSGRIILGAGIAYVALWVVVFAARFGFAVIATNSPDTLRGLFVWAYEHGITEAGWTASFMLQAIAMVGVRTLVILARAMAAGRSFAAITAL